MKQPALPLAGIVACNEIDDKGSTYYAAIEPSNGPWWYQFLPHVQRWWYEIEEIEKEPTDELGIGVATHAYTTHGSGGAWTFRGAVIKSRMAIEKIVEEANNERNQ